MDVGDLLQAPMGFPAMNKFINEIFVKDLLNNHIIIKLAQQRYKLSGSKHRADLLRLIARVLDCESWGLNLSFW